MNPQFPVLLSCVLAWILPLQGQTAPGSPQAKTRQELTAFGLVVESDDPLYRVRRGEEFLAHYPDSEFREKVLELELNAFKERNDLAAARRVGAKVLQMNPENPFVLAELATLIANENEPAAFPTGERYAQQVLSHSAEMAQPSRLSRADFFRLKQDLNATACAALGLMALRRGNGGEARNWLLRTIQLRPRLLGSDYLRLGEAFMKIKDSSQAKGALGQAVSLGPAIVAEKAREHLRGLQR